MQNDNNINITFHCKNFQLSPSMSLDSSFHFAFQHPFATPDVIDDQWASSTLSDDGQLFVFQFKITIVH
jgi:hypothetical protein